MQVGQLGELTRDPAIEEWLVSKPLKVPLFSGVKLSFVLEGYENDPRPEEFVAAVENFLKIRQSDQSETATHIFMNYNRHLAAVGGGHLPGRISSPGDVWRHVHPTAIHVSRRHRRDKKVYVQVVANCDWEVEHGLQLVYRDGSALSRVSQQDGHLTYADAYNVPEHQDRIS